MIARKTPRPPALWKQIQAAKAPAEAKSAGKVARRPKSAPRRALWHTAFPEKVDKRVEQETAADRTLYRKESKADVDAARKRGETCPVLAAFDQLPPEMQAALIVPWTGNRRSNRLEEVHHSHGRRGRLLNYKPWWIFMSRFGHRVVHMFPKVARRFGWLCDPGQWNVQPPKQS
jgi:hypothetical protein